MTLKSKLKVESLGVAVFSIFYAIVGVAIISMLALSNFTIPHMVVLAFLNLITAYGLFKMKKWAVLLTIVLFFLGTTFGATTLYGSIMIEPFFSSIETSLLNLTLIAYMIGLFAALIYVAAKRENFQ
ncbi:hypothetical protein E3J74_08460 [Candidatus Bathyarchaeota archaeon]|nr:MAG: hypothetical protein E3J74_08460 [Candidatus Bathyarchaeota archaeon]